MNELFLLKLGEMVLKGLNRRRFEDQLLGNLRRRLAPYGRFRLYTRQSICYVEPQSEDCDLEGAYDALKHVFGVAVVVRAHSCEKTAEDFVRAALEYLSDDLRQAKSFKVESKRSDKTFPMTSIQLSQYVGGRLAEQFPKTPVDVHNPDLTVHLEVRDYAGYVYAGGEEGAGGLPVGSSGRAVALLSGGIDSPVACYMMARRGVRLDCVHFFSYPYTSNEAKDKVLELASLITPYTGKLCVHIVPFTKIQEMLREKCPEPYFTLAMRRFMMRISELVAQRIQAGALVTGESLGQVASQTMEALGCTEDAVTLPVFRPVVGMDKEEIIHIARQIGTFETSILPYEDCCTVFTPRHPRTHPTVAELREIEQGYDFEGLCQEAFQQIERVIVPVRTGGI
ncbi:MAG: tRNA 4-thiouridine(8) synthase ThiI [Clostridiales bacterium]|nr:tRNA 4-thiouridine(8) synthase ThiI [Clostridiales bacterium]